MALNPKEEAVLSLIGEDSAYENYFFKRASDIKWFDPLKSKYFFSPEKDPAPKPADQEGYFTIPEWNVLPYLERVSQQVSIPGNEKYVDELLAIIKDVSNYKDTSGQHIDNYRTWFYFVKILLNLPNDKITEEIINLIPIWLDSKFSTTLPDSEIATKLLPKFLTDNPEDIKKAEKIIESITAIKTFPLPEERAKLLGKNEGTKFVIDSYWLEEAFKKYSEIIGEKCSDKVIEGLAGKIRNLLKREEDGTYRSFHEESEHLTSEPLDILTFVLKRILLSKAKSDIKTIEVILKDFLKKDKYLYFPKMALYVIGQNSETYNNLFWEILDSNVGEFIMEKTLYFGDELKHILENLKKLTDEQRETLNIKIETTAKRHAFKEEPERYNALCKQEIYQALSHDQYFKNLYEEMKKITNVDAQLHPALGEIETRWGPGPSPLAKEEILRTTNKELAGFLSTLKTKNFWRGPTVGGLSETLKEAVKTNPNKFTDNLCPFEDVGFVYVYKILDGIKDAWKEKKAIDWGKVFNFIASYIKKEQFWKDEYIVEKGEWLGGANHEWVVGIIAELIQDGTQDDSWAFPKSHFEKAEKIIFLILDNLKIEEDKEITDYVTYTLNTPFGKAITALILLALRIARVNDKKGIVSDIKWKPEFKERYEEILRSKIIEGFTWLGRYLPNFYYLDKEWVKEKIRFLENEKGSKSWEAFMDGYLSIGRVYDDLYNFMKPHYQYGIDYNFKEKRDNGHLIQHISLAYLRGHEDLIKPENLFNQILAKFKHDSIKEIIGFFWMQRSYLRVSSEENKKIRAKIIEFWRLLYEKYKGKDESILSREDKQILSAASKLTALLPQIDADSREWLMLSAPYVHEDYNSSFFIEYLNELKDKGERTETAKYIGNIYLKMLEKITPDFDQKHIRSIVEFLYNVGATDSANRICNIYGTRGHEFLRDIYEKHSNKA